MSNKIKNYFKKPIFHIKVLYLKLFGPLKSLLGLGSLPNYLIIGTQKGGTSSLQKYLEQHPFVLSPLRKEIHFFNKDYKRGLKWYKRFFPIFKSKNKIVGEATPYYMFHPLVAERVSKLLPNIKIIVILRNPVERAYSHYKMKFKAGNEKNTFQKALKVEKNRLKKEKNNLNRNNKFDSYLERGLYLKQLKPWFNYFKKDKILVLKSEDLYSNTQEVVSQTFKFLNLKDFKLKDLRPHNVGIKKQLDKKIEKELYDFFKKPNQELYKFLNKDFNWNK